MEEKRVITFSQIKERTLCKIKEAIEYYSSSDDDLCFETMQMIRRNLSSFAYFDFISYSKLGELEDIVSLIIDTRLNEGRWMEYHEYSNL